MRKPKYNPETERFIVNIPTKCPRCGCRIGLDTRYKSNGDSRTYAICSNNDCEYKFDVSEELDIASEAYNIEDDENEEDDND